jgi:hypothetical protein
MSGSMIKTPRKRRNKVGAKTPFEVTPVSEAAKAAFFHSPSRGTTLRQRDGSSPDLRAALAAVNRKHGRLLRRLAG